MSSKDTNFDVRLSRAQTRGSRRPTARPLATVLAVTLAAGSLAAMAPAHATPAASSRPHTPRGSGPRSTETRLNPTEAASARAKATGKPVTIDQLTDTGTTVVANPTLESDRHEQRAAGPHRLPVVAILDRLRSRPRPLAVQDDGVATGRFNNDQISYMLGRAHERPPRPTYYQHPGQTRPAERMTTADGVTLVDVATGSQAWTEPAGDAASGEEPWVRISTPSRRRVAPASAEHGGGADAQQVVGRV